MKHFSLILFLLFAGVLLSALPVLGSSTGRLYLQGIVSDTINIKWWNGKNSNISGEAMSRSIATVIDDDSLFLITTSNSKIAHEVYLDDEGRASLQLIDEKGNSLTHKISVFPKEARSLVVNIRAK